MTLIEKRHRSEGPAITLQFERVDTAHGLDPRSLSVTVGNTPQLASAEGDLIHIDVRGLVAGKHHLTVRARDTAGRDIEPFTHPVWVEKHRFRWQDALIYQVMLDRFAGPGPLTLADPGARAGGDLRGLLARVEAGDFERLGVNALWISPLNRNPTGLWAGVEGGAARYSSYHGYWPMAGREVDPVWGTDADVEALVAAAHARGIRVLMDVVLNHVHASHPSYAAHPEWFTHVCLCGTAACPWSTAIETCWLAAVAMTF